MTKAVYVIGGGASLSGFDWDALAGKPCIAVNTAYRVKPDADYLISGDKRFLQNHEKELYRFKGEFINNTQGAEWLLADLGIDKQINSGLQAIAFAALKGFKRIYLLGFDMCRVENKSHWHSGTHLAHPHYIEDSAYTQFEADAQQFMHLLKIKYPKIKVFNASPVYQGTAFPKINLSEVLHG